MNNFTFKMFNSFSIVDLDKNKTITVNWRTQKVKEVFIYLLHQGDKKVTVDDLTSMFWQDLSYVSAKSQVYSTIYHIRLMVEKYKLPIEIVSKSGTYSVDITNLNIDVKKFLDYFSLVEQATLENEEIFKNNLSLYKGDYLGLEGYDWSYYQRVKYRVIWLKRKQSLINLYIETNRELDAIIELLEMQEIAPNYEWSYEKMIELLSYIGDFDAIHKQKQGLKQTREENERVKEVAN